MNIPNNVVLVRVRVSKPSASKVDQMLTSEIAAKHGTDADAVRASKSLFDLRAANSAGSKIRAWLRENAVPWSAITVTATGEKKADAMWAVRGKQIKEFSDMNRECRESFETERDRMVSNYDDILLDRQRALGTAFKASDYPAVEEFEEQWSWEMTLEPLTTADSLEGDFRLAGVPEDVIEEQVDRYKESISEKVAGVARNVIQRVQKEILGKGTKDKGLLAGLEMYDPDETDKRKGNTFRDTRLYDNMDELREFAAEIFEVFPHDEEIGTMKTQLDDFCENVRPEDPEEVRTDEAVRQRVIDGLRGLLDPEDAKSDGAEGDAEETAGAGFANVL